MHTNTPLMIANSCILNCYFYNRNAQNKNMTKN
jgi:hypothetical protein